MALRLLSSLLLCIIRGRISGPVSNITEDVKYPGFALDPGYRRCPVIEDSEMNI